jgi:hypothetical protein
MTTAKSPRTRYCSAILRIIDIQVIMKVYVYPFYPCLQCQEWHHHHSENGFPFQLDACMFLGPGAQCVVAASGPVAAFSSKLLEARICACEGNVNVSLVRTAS